LFVAGAHSFAPRFLTSKDTTMNYPSLIATLVATLCLAACDRPTIVTVPAAPVALPGPPGPQGATGATGSEGSQGATGKPGDGTTVIVMPAASAPSN
jgi:hypothetical protein